MCQIYSFDENTGFVELMRDGKTWDKRGKVNPPPCRTRIGCVKGTPEDPIEMSAANRQCYEHYQQCRAIGLFPNVDPIMMENAAIIRGVHDKFDAYERKSMTDKLTNQIDELGHLILISRG